MITCMNTSLARPVSRRSLLRIGAATCAALSASCTYDADPTAPPSGRSASTASETTSGPRSGGTGTGGPTLRIAAAPASYRPQLLAVLRRHLKPTPANPKHPAYAGAVALVAVNGEIVVHEAVGDALRYGNGPVEL